MGRRATRRRGGRGGSPGGELSHGESCPSPTTSPFHVCPPLEGPPHRHEDHVRPLDGRLDHLLRFLGGALKGREGGGRSSGKVPNRRKIKGGGGTFDTYQANVGLAAGAQAARELLADLEPPAFGHRRAGERLRGAEGPFSRVERVFQGRKSIKRLVDPPVSFKGLAPERPCSQSKTRRP